MSGLSPPPHSRTTILGVPVSSITLNSALDQIAAWISEKQSRYICVADVHSVIKAQDDERHRSNMAAADMITPDGTPLVWMSRLRGDKAISRVCGPDLMLAVCKRSVSENWRHYLLGGAEGIPERLATRLTEQFPGLSIAGAYSPPFRPPTPEEDAAIVADILASGADIVWIGLGCPKQERWMAEHKAALPGVILIGVGAAFNFHVGTIRRAPIWMRKNGLEWLHRLLSEPRRLWRRYLVDAPRFASLSLLETVRFRVNREA